LIEIQKLEKQIFINQLQKTLNDIFNSTGYFVVNGIFTQLSIVPFWNEKYLNNEDIKSHQINTGFDNFIPDNSKKD
jgi:hypothetical protein